MMAYIDAGKIKESIEALEYLISGNCTDTPVEFSDEIELAIRVLKSYADVAEVKHGKWEDIADYDASFEYGVCSVCGGTTVCDEYCGKCGAKMDGGGE